MSPDELAAGLRRLGVRPGGVLMAHTRMSALGHVEGAEDGVVRAMLLAIGEEGTLLAYVSWDDIESGRPFDPVTARAMRDHGRVPERIRTWPGAVRSDNPEAGVAAVGPLADWLCAPHDDGYGERSPFARVVQASGQVLMLGAPLETVTLVHHAEALAGAPVTERYEVALPDGTTRSYRDHNTSGEAFDYASLGLPEDEIAVIARSALVAGAGLGGELFGAPCHLFEAPALVEHALAWLRERF